MATTRLRGGGPNYLIEVKGKLVLVSGATGEVKALSEDDRDLVLPLLRERQELGRKLAELLEKRGFDFSVEGTVELFVEPEARSKKARKEKLKKKSKEKPKEKPKKKR